MSAITDAAMLPRLPDSTNNFVDVANANSVADEGIQTVTDAAAQQKAAQVQQAPFQKIVHKFNPKTGKYDVSLDLSGDTFDYLGNLLQTGQATMQAFGQARAELQAKRQFQEQHPIVSAIGKIASTSAAQYAGGGRGRDISPIVRAAGAFGLEQFGQSNAELAQQEAALTGQQFGVANQLYNQNQQDVAAKAQASYQNRSLGIQENAQKIQLQRDQEADLERVNDNYRAIAGQGSVTPAIVENYKKEFMRKGGTLEAANAGAKNLADQNAAHLAQRGLSRQTIVQGGHTWDVWSDPATGDVKKKIDLGVADLTPSQELARQKRTDDTNTIEGLAGMLISKDPFMLTRVKDSLSTRNDLAGRATIRAKQLDPSWSPQATEERVNLVNDLTKGKLGDSMASLGQWLNHAAELQSAAQALRQTDSKLLNKSINWMTENVTDGPRAQLVSRLRTAVQPVGDEFNNFILAGRAPYQSDKEALAKILDLNKPLNQQLAALNQMGKTIGGRYSEQNNKWQRWFGQDIPLSVSPQAQQSAANLGIPIKMSVSPNAPPPATTTLSPAEQKIIDDFRAGKISADEARKQRAAL